MQTGTPYCRNRLPTGRAIRFFEQAVLEGDLAAATIFGLPGQATAQSAREIVELCIERGYAGVQGANLTVSVAPPRDGLTERVRQKRDLAKRKELPTSPSAA